MSFIIDAETWDKYLSDVYPGVKEKLGKDPGIVVRLPISAKDNAKEEIFKQEVIEDSHEIRDRHLNSGRKGNYTQGWTNDNISGFHALADTVGLGLAFAPAMVNPIFLIVPAIYLLATESLTYVAGKRFKERIIQNLGNIANNISIHYVEKL